MSSDIKNYLKQLIAFQSVSSDPEKKDKKIRVINLSRNFGKEKAMTAGIDYSIGDAVIPIDADLQDPPELIPKLIQKWYEGYDVVYATRSKRRGETLSISEFVALANTIQGQLEILA